jgi:lysophospholipid acyltransferase (LPLAT)-like uncharacterized protein
LWENDTTRELCCIYIDSQASIIYTAFMAVPKRYVRLGTLAGWIYRIYSSTWTYRVTFSQGSTPFDFKTKSPQRSLVIGHWHGDELAQISFCRHARYLALASHSKDGTIRASALKVMGLEVARGSSSRGGARALVSMLRKIREAHFYVSFAMDGPTGPRHIAKPGIHLFASKAKLPIYQCLARCNRRWDFPSTWNKTYLPKPFARIHLYFYELPPILSDNRDHILGLINSRTVAPDDNWESGL